MRQKVLKSMYIKRDKKNFLQWQSTKLADLDEFHFAEYVHFDLIYTSVNAELNWSVHIFISIQTP